MVGPVARGRRRDLTEAFFSFERNAFALHRGYVMSPPMLNKICQFLSLYVHSSEAIMVIITIFFRLSNNMLDTKLFCLD